MNIDIIDFNLLNKKNPSELLRLNYSLRKPGFSFLKNHELNEDHIMKSLKCWKDFIQLSETIRNTYVRPEAGYQVGYTPMRIETGVDAKNADEKHFWHTRDANSLLVSQIPNFKETQDDLFRDFDELYQKLMVFVAKTLRLPESHFNDCLSNSVLRTIHYPPQENPLKDDGEVNEGGNSAGLCAYKHTDINLLTLLLARDKGLELLCEDVWKEVETYTEENLIVVNCGDMLEHLTGGFYTSGVHRVVCEKNKDRFSFPFFGHLKPEFPIVPTDLLNGKSEKYPYKTAGDFLNARLKDIAQKK